jgi:putative membrane protein
MNALLRHSTLAGLLVLAPAALAQNPAAGNAAMSDAELLHVFITANRGEIVTSEPLLDDLGSAETRQYAEQMIAEHTRVLQQAEALDIEPRDNPVSMSMTMIATGKAQKLDRMDAPELDMHYMESQVVLHGHTLDMLDFVLIPNADDEQFRALLEQVRPNVEMHLRRAEQIAHQMMAAHGGMMPGGETSGQHMNHGGMNQSGQGQTGDDQNRQNQNDDNR